MSVLLSATYTAASALPPVAQTSLGPVVGLRTGATNSFLGIPYAEPPVGELRWKDPIDYSTPYALPGWDATAYGAVCPQQSGGSSSAVTGEEDCLFLNVHVPAGVSAAAVEEKTSTPLLPVMVFLHGGGLLSGSGSAYNGSSLAASNGTVVVTLNYRLGALGMLALDEAQSDAQPTGNYAYLDQRAALRWVSREIASFGGDPDRVTLFGESAGATSVCVHLASEASYGLFSAALTESAYVCDAYWSKADALAITDTYAAAAGCSVDASANANNNAKSNSNSNSNSNNASTSANVTCLRALAVSDVLDFSGSVGKFPHPTLDLVNWAEPPMRTLSEGRGAASTDVDMPFAGGYNTDEASFFVPPDLFLDAAAYEAQLASLLSNASLLDEALALYPPDANASANNRDAYVLAFTHQAIECCTLRLARAMSSSSNSNSNSNSSSSFSLSWLYWFDAYDECDFDPAVYGVPHTAELRYVFDSWDAGGCDPPDADATSLSRHMQAKLWSGFAVARAMPNEWPPAFQSSDSDPLEIHLVKGDAPYDVVAGRDADYCAFWEKDSPFGQQER